MSEEAKELLRNLKDTYIGTGEKKKLVGRLTAELYPTFHKKELPYFGYGIAASKGHSYNGNFGEESFANSWGIVAENSNFTSRAFHNSFKSAAVNCNFHDWAFSNAIFAQDLDCTFGNWAYNNASHFRSVGSEFGHGAFGQAEQGLVYAKKSHSIKPKSGIYVIEDLEKLEPSADALVFSPAEVEGVIRIANSDLSGEWTLKNLPERLKLICKKYGIDPNKARVIL